jgi:mRNA degradation ribonuclease J1/J2
MQVIDIISPQVVIPVHSDKPHLYARALEGRHQYVLPERGVSIVL